MIVIFLVASVCLIHYSNAANFYSDSYAKAFSTSRDGNVDIALNEVLQEWQQNTDSTCLWNMNNVQEICANQTLMEAARKKQKSSTFAQAFINSIFVDLFCETFNTLLERTLHYQRRDAVNQMEHLKHLAGKVNTWINGTKSMPKELLKDAMGLYRSIQYSIEQIKALIRQTNNIQWPVESITAARRDLLFGLTQRFLAPSVQDILKKRTEDTALEDSFVFINKNRNELRQMIRRNYNRTLKDPPPEMKQEFSKDHKIVSGELSLIDDHEHEHEEMVEGTCIILVMIKSHKECDGLDRKVYKSEGDCCAERIHEHIPKPYQNKFEMILHSGDISALTYYLTVNCHYHKAVFLTYTLLDLHKMFMQQQISTLSPNLLEENDDENKTEYFEATIMETIFYLLHQTITQSDCALINKDN